METERLADDRIDTEVTAAERWRPVRGYEGFYSVSDRGRVRRDAAGKGARVGKVLSAAVVKSTGYRRVSLVVGGRQSGFHVHRLVAEAFIGLRPAGLSVNHIDGDKLNNTPTNLEYLTLADNARHAWGIGLCRPLLIHCHRGHPFDAANTITCKDGQRECLACSRQRKREYKARKRAALVAGRGAPRDGGGSVPVDRGSLADDHDDSGEVKR